MHRINKNFIKRKIYKCLPQKIRLRLFSYLLPDIEPNLKNFMFRTATSPEDYLAAFNLVYKIFLKTGYIKASPTPFRLAPQHCNENSRVFIGLHNEKSIEKLVYSISIFPDSIDGLPMDMVFRKELDELRKQGRFLVEAGHLAADSSYKMNTMNVPMLGNKILHQYAHKHLRADDIVIAVHPKYQWFYEELLLFEKLSEIESYAYANNNPAVAMRLDLKTMKTRYKKAYKNIALNKSMYHFFFKAHSTSIFLPDEHTHVEKRLLENLRHMYGLGR